VWRGRARGDRPVDPANLVLPRPVFAAAGQFRAGTGQQARVLAAQQTVEAPGDRQLHQPVLPDDHALHLEQGLLQWRFRRRHLIRPFRAAPTCFSNITLQREKTA
jgi:hypothetical protein